MYMMTNDDKLNNLEIEILNLVEEYSNIKHKSIDFIPENIICACKR